MKLYDHTVERIKTQSDDDHELVKVLMWVTYAVTAHSIESLQDALALELEGAKLDHDSCPKVDDIVSACAGLVTVDEE